MDRVLKHNILAMSGRAVEAAGDVNVLLLDKTGTITLGNREAGLVPAPASAGGARRGGAALVARRRNSRGPVHRRAREAEVRPAGPRASKGMKFVPFTAATRMSGVDFDGRKIRKGAGDSVWSGSEPGGEIVRRQRTTSTGSPARERRPSSSRTESACWASSPAGHRQGGDAGTLRPAARDGHPHHHDHGRQSADGRDDRAGGGRRRLSRAGHARSRSSRSSARNRREATSSR